MSNYVELMTSEIARVMFFKGVDPDIARLF